jgi:hypothetical protein
MEVVFAHAHAAAAGKGPRDARARTHRYRALPRERLRNMVIQLDEPVEHAHGEHADARVAAR